MGEGKRIGRIYLTSTHAECEEPQKARTRREVKGPFGEKVKGKAKGFSYHVDRVQIDTYKAWPMPRRMQWLLEGNKLRRSLPAKTKAIQEAFRQGKI